MRKRYSIKEISDLLDHVVSIANLTHESDIETAIKLKLPDAIISHLRARAIRAIHIEYCNCPDCQ